MHVRRLSGNRRGACAAREFDRKQRARGRVPVLCSGNSARRGHLYRGIAQRDYEVFRLAEDTKASITVPNDGKDRFRLIDASTNKDVLNRRA